MAFDVEHLDAFKVRVQCSKTLDPPRTGHSTIATNRLNTQK
jgi:hypothetical protein